MSKNTAGNDFSHFAAMTLLVIIIIPFILVFFGFISEDALSSEGLIGLLTTICEAIPFGNNFCEAAIGIASSITGFISDTAELTNEMSKYTPSSYLFELAKLIVATVFYEALFGAGKVVTGLKGRKGFWIRGQEALLSVFCAFCAGITSSVAMRFMGNQISSLPQFVQMIITGAISAGSLIGLFYVLKLFATTFVLSKFIAGVIVEHLVVNAIKLAATYVFSLLIVIGVAYGNWGYVVCSSSGLILIFILMEAISLIIKPIFE